MKPIESNTQEEEAPVILMAWCVYSISHISFKFYLLHLNIETDDELACKR